VIAYLLLIPPLTFFFYDILCKKFHFLSVPLNISNTVKPFMFACLLFRELNKTAKLKGVNIDTVPTLIGVTHVLESCGLNSPK